MTNYGSITNIPKNSPLNSILRCSAQEIKHTGVECLSELSSIIIECLSSILRSEIPKKVLLQSAKDKTG